MLSMDILPTILSLADIEPGVQFDGKDYSGVLFSQDEFEERPLLLQMKMYLNGWIKEMGKYRQIIN